MLTFEELKTDDCRWPVAVAIGRNSFLRRARRKWSSILRRARCYSVQIGGATVRCRSRGYRSKGYEGATPAALSTTDDDPAKIVKTGAYPSCHYYLGRTTVE